MADPREWLSVIAYLVRPLEELIGHPVDIDDPDPTLDTDAFSVWVRGRWSSGVGDAQRLGIVGHPHGSSVHLDFEAVAGEPGRWRNRGWQTEESDEWNGLKLHRKPAER